MKNKLLVSVFATAVAAFAFTSCEKNEAPSVMDVNSDMVKESIHKTTRSLALLDGEVLTMEEFEFPGGVNDNRLIYRTIAFGTRHAQVYDSCRQAVPPENLPTGPGQARPSRCGNQGMP